MFSLGVPISFHPSSFICLSTLKPSSLSDSSLYFIVITVAAVSGGFVSTILTDKRLGGSGKYEKLAIICMFFSTTIFIGLSLLLISPLHESNTQLFSHSIQLVGTCAVKVTV